MAGIPAVAPVIESLLMEDTGSAMARENALPLSTLLNTVGSQPSSNVLNLDAVSAGTNGYVSPTQSQSGFSSSIVNASNAMKSIPFIGPMASFGGSILNVVMSAFGMSKQAAENERGYQRNLKMYNEETAYNRTRDAENTAYQRAQSERNWKYLDENQNYKRAMDFVTHLETVSNRAPVNRTNNYQMSLQRTPPIRTLERV